MGEPLEKGSASGVGRDDGNVNGAVGPSSQTKKQLEEQYVLEVHDEVLSKLNKTDDKEFDQKLWAHFHRLPARYTLSLSECLSPVRHNDCANFIVGGV